MEGDVGVVAVKMDNDFLREESEKEGDVVGLLEDGVTNGGVLGCESGGKSTREVKDGRVGGVVWCEEGVGSETRVCSGAVRGGEPAVAGEDLNDEDMFKIGGKVSPRSA